METRSPCVATGDALELQGRLKVQSKFKNEKKGKTFLALRPNKVGRCQVGCGPQATVWLPFSAAESIISYPE